MSSLSRLAQIGYVFALSLALSLLLWPTLSRAQFGVSTGYRSTSALPTLSFPFLTNGSGSAGGSGSGIFGAGGGSGSASGSFTTQIIHVHPGDFLPNNGQIVGMPPATLMPPLNNLITDDTASPLAALFGLNAGGGLGIGGVSFGGGFVGIGGGGGIAGGGGGIAGGLGMGGGMGGFAGKGMGGFNGKKPL